MNQDQQYILAIDQGTTSSRAIIFDRSGKPVAIAQKSFKQWFPQPGWVEHDAAEIWSTQAAVIAEVIAKAGLNGKAIAGIGITNQRETTIVWDRKTGQPLCHAIVWQDRRTSSFCDELRAEGKAEMIREKTGLVLDAYFSATKVKWILDHVKGARARAQNGELCFGTVDSWLIWKLTMGKMHITDVTNASRTMLFNIHTLQWDNELLNLFDIPESMLPAVKSCSEVYGETATTLFATKIPIAGIAGDQQAALFGQLCTEVGSAKNTYGTGCFLMMNTGNRPVVSKNNLLTTIAWQLDGQVSYALEGSVFSAGSAVQWLRDGLGIIQHAAQTEVMARSVPNNGGIYFVPSLTGLGAPNWDQYSRGMMIGITRGTTAAHIVRATLESICFQVYDVVYAMSSDMEGASVLDLKVDGGAVGNDFLMQFQSDILGIPVIRPVIQESTALGVAYLAGLAVGYWKDIAEIKAHQLVDRVFEPSLESIQVKRLIDQWHRAVDRSKRWIIPEEDLLINSLN
ncbi:MAG: glycerol kinase GlpK [Sphingobacteriaceae bacterium]|jgi:glycerol kinase|nr:MAG: glycerol kinase GlpK [Pedobacter sp.]